MRSGRRLSANPETSSTRDLIFGAAERLFAEHGFAAVTMREIAAAAGLKNQASLYHHFRDKRALYEAVLARGLNPIIALVIESGRAGARAAADSGRNRLGAFETVTDRLLDYLAEHPHLPRLIQRAGIDDSRYLHNAMTELLLPLYSEGLSVLEGIAGPWQVSDLPHVAIGIYHLIFGYFADAALLEFLLQADPRSPAAVARQRRFVKAAVAQLIGVATERGSEVRAHAS
ncbi:MAG: TetR/AcrR family transcriptional regulator [Deltaproteobacteria bacterium]|nr:TetR/AcrR family transcriptional regulator [Deltaproteobacteria bacterium]